MFDLQELQHISVLNCLPETLRTRIAGVAADLHLCEGEWLIREGESPWFYVLVEGTLDLMKEINGKATHVARYKPGDFLGEVPILLGTTAFASVRAKEPSRVLRLDRMQFKHMIDGSPECSALVMQTMSSRITAIQEYIRETPSVRVLVIGEQYDVDCRDIRSFLSANRIPYKWIDRQKYPEHIPSCLPRDMEGPAVVIDRERCVEQPPTVRKVAEALGFQVQAKADGYDVLIVGAGPAGLAAGVYGASEGLKTLVIERSNVGGQAGTSSRIENYLGFPNGVSGDELSERATRQAARFGAEIVVTREVKNIHPLREGGYCVEMDGGERLTSRCVVLATGVEWRRLDAEGVDRLQGRGVLYGASRMEAGSIVGKDIFIVGGGNSAGQAAVFFASYARTVTMLVRGAGLKLTMSQYLIEQMKRLHNITIEPFTQVVSVGGETSLETICTSTRGAAPVSRPANAMFIMIGADATTDWLPKGLTRDERGYVCTGRDLSEHSCGERGPFLLETNLPGFFCVGDVRHDSIKRVSSSVGEGSMAIAFVHQYLAIQERSRVTSALA